MRIAAFTLFIFVGLSGFSARKFQNKDFPCSQFSERVSGYSTNDGQSKLVEELCHRLQNNGVKGRFNNNIRKFMKLLKLKGDSNSTVCKGCKAVVGFIKMELEVFNLTEKKVIEGVKEICELVAPLKIQTQLCDDIVDYIDEIIQKILSGVSPGNICVDLKLCPSPATHTWSNRFWNPKSLAKKNKKTSNTFSNSFLKKFHKKSNQLKNNRHFKNIMRKIKNSKKYNPIPFRQLNFENFWKTFDERKSKDAEESEVTDENFLKTPDHGEFDETPRIQTRKVGIDYSEYARDQRMFNLDPVFPTEDFTEDEINDFLGEEIEETNEEKDIKIETPPSSNSPFDNFKNILPFFPRTRGGSFQNLISRKMEKAINDTFGMFESRSSSMKGAGCAFCQTIVKVITWEVKTVNASIKIIENEVKAICKLYPLEVAQNACLVIINDVDEIIQLIEKDVEPGEICQKIGLCANSLKKGVMSRIAPSPDCKPLCSYFKGKYETDIRMVTNKWVATKELMVRHCENNEHPEKCARILTIFEKAERQLGSVMQTGNLKKDKKLCRCFKKQPIFITAENDKCQLCKQLEKGLKNELKEVKSSLDYLIETMKTFCQSQSSSAERGKCMDIMNHLNTSFTQLEEKMLNIDVCSRLGFCNQISTILGKGFHKWTSGLIGSFFRNPFGYGKKSTGCEFCKTCVDDIEKTITSANATEKAEEIIPAVKDGFSIFCEMKSVGAEAKSVCKTINKGMEIIHQSIQKRTDGASMCRMFGAC